MQENNLIKLPTLERILLLSDGKVNLSLGKNSDGSVLTYRVGLGLHPKWLKLFSWSPWWLTSGCCIEEDYSTVTNSAIPQNSQPLFKIKPLQISGKIPGEDYRCVPTLLKGEVKNGDLTGEFIGIFLTGRSLYPRYLRGKILPDGTLFGEFSDQYNVGTNCYSSNIEGEIKRDGSFILEFKGRHRFRPGYAPASYIWPNDIMQHLEVSDALRQQDPTNYFTDLRGELF